jgi:hypothetical protein
MTSAGFPKNDVQMIHDPSDIVTMQRLFRAIVPYEAYLFGRELGEYAACVKVMFLKTGSQQYSQPFTDWIERTSKTSCLFPFTSAYSYLTKEAEGAFREFLDCHMSRPMRRPVRHNILSLVADCKIYGVSSNVLPLEKRPARHSHSL